MKMKNKEKVSSYPITSKSDSFKFGALKKIKERNIDKTNKIFFYAQ
jgi:hypothetical protein